MSQEIEDILTEIKVTKVWHRKVLLTSLYHSAMKQMYGEWSVHDTRLALDMSVGWVSESLQLARLMDTDNTLINLATRNQAIARLNRYG